MILFAMMNDPIEGTSLRMPRSRKRLAKILAAKLNLPDVTTLMNVLLEREINRHFSKSTQEELLEQNDEDFGEGGASYTYSLNDQRAEYKIKPKKGSAGQSKAA